MTARFADPERLRAAWKGRASGCIFEKAVEVLSFEQGHAGLSVYPGDMGALPPRNYVPLKEGSLVDEPSRNCCLGHITRAEPDDDINCTVLALMLVEEKGSAFDTADVARAWLRLVPAGTTWNGAQIRADLYGRVCPGRPGLAAELALDDLVVRTVAVANQLDQQVAA